MGERGDEISLLAGSSLEHIHIHIQIHIHTRSQLEKDENP